MESRVAVLEERADRADEDRRETTAEIKALRTLLYKLSAALAVVQSAVALVIDNT